MSSLACILAFSFQTPGCVENQPKFLGSTNEKSFLTEKTPYHIHTTKKAWMFAMLQVFLLVKIHLEKTLVRILVSLSISEVCLHIKVWKF